MSNNSVPTQEEIWDDSALLDTWDAALAEYKHYHSLHARGEMVEDVLAKAEKQELNEHNGNIANTAMEVDQERGAQAGVMEEGEVLQEERVEAHAQILASGTTMAPGFSTNGESTFHEGSRVPVAADHPQQTIPSMMSSMPQNLLGPGNEEALKNLMMSWYYAGYYTGLYEGQQKAQNTAPQSTQG